MSTFHSLKIAEVKRETSEAISVFFEIPEPLKTSYSFIPGQYITVLFILNGEEVRRSYSICSTSSEKNIRIAIKAVKDGSFSVFANANLKAGDYLDVSFPEGRFTIETANTNQNNYAAFVAGSGITPVFSIIKSVLEKEPNSTFVLTYGNKSPEQTIFYKELHDLELKYTGRFFIHFVYSTTKVDHQLFGRIDKAAVHFVVKNKYKELDFNAYFICGPEAMIDLVYDTLIENNVTEEQIKFELFTSSKKEATVTALDGQCEISVLVDDEETTFVMSPKLTVLDAVLKQGLDVPYSCQGGVCSSCLCRVTEGTAVMKKNSILTDKEIADGLILSCQAIPTSSVLKVDYDDI